MFAQNVSIELSLYVFPPFYLIAPVLKFLKEQKPNSCTLVYPYLTPLPCWWPIRQSLGVDKFSVREDAFLLMKD